MMKKEIPAHMRAMVLTAPGQYEIKTIPVPVPGPGEALCQIGAVAICGSDPEIFRGDIAGDWPPSYPFIAGHEWAGKIVALGEGVTGFQVGDRVAGEAHKGCGYCRNCMEGRYTICLNYGKPETGHRHYGFKTFGAYAQYQVFHTETLTPLPDCVSFGEGAMADTAGVALHGIERGGLCPGATAVIVGPGPIGMMTLKLARALGAARIIVIGRNPRLERAVEMGCDDAVDFTLCDPVERVRELTGGVGADICYECSGSRGSVSQGIRMVRKGGHVVMLGVAPDTVIEEIPFKYTTANEITIFGSKANPNTGWKYLELLKNKRVYVKDMITHTFSLEEMTQAVDTFVHRKEGAMKVVVYPNGGEDI